MSLDDIRARAEAASEGPWFAVRYYVGSGQDQGDPDAEVATTGHKPDAQFIANSRQDIPRLLAALDAVLAWAHELADGPSEGRDDLNQESVGETLLKLVADAMGDAA